jgi:hypothetical protein
MFAQGNAQLWGRMPAHQKSEAGKFEGCGRKERLKKEVRMQWQESQGSKKGSGFPAHEWRCAELEQISTGSLYCLNLSCTGA